MRSTFFLLFFLPLFTFAQTRNGPRAGLSMATISGGQFLNWSGLPKFGPIGGWAWEVKWTNQASFLFEPMYMSKGSLTQDPMLNSWTRVRLGYLELPIMVKLSLDKEPEGIFLTGGLIGGYWINGKQVVKQDGTVLLEQQYALTGAKNREQASVAAGLGWDRKNTAFEVRIQTSVTPFSPVVRGQNLVVGLHFTYYIPKKGSASKKKDKDLAPDQ